MNPNLLTLIIQAVQAYGTTGTTNTNRVFDNSTNAGWGANAYINSVFAPSTTLAYTHQSTEGSLFTGKDNKQFSIESALGFSELALQTADGKFGNGDGSVSISEFKKTSGASTAVATAVDTDGDGKITRSELTAYYMLADELDGSLNGKITRSGISEVKDLADDDPDTLKAKLQAYQTQIATANANFTLEAPVVDGTDDDGSYDATNILGQAANAGEATAKILGTTKQLFTNVKFGYGTTADEKIQSGLAFATSLLGGSKVIASSCKLNVPDLNKDGFISADEVLAGLMAQDANGDGQVTYAERLAYEKAVKAGDITASDIQDIYDNNDLESAAEDFEMPDKEDGTNIGTGSNDFLAIIKQLLAQFGINL